MSARRGARESGLMPNTCPQDALIPDNAQTEVPAEEFLSKHAGMIFRVSYAIAGVQTTVIEYFSVSKLRAQLADMS